MSQTFNVPTCVAALVLLAIAAACALLAQRRGWRPSLRVTLLVAVVIRLAMMLMSARIYPYDFTHDFRDAATAVLAHHDPILSGRQGGWNYLPTYAYILAGAQWLTLHLHVPWWVAGRIAPIAFDLGVVVLVGRLAGKKKELRRFQYACNPVMILVSAVHGQMEPVCLFFAVGALLLVVGRGRSISAPAALAAGALLGLGISVKTWPAIFGPVLLLALPDLRRRVALVLGAGGVVGGLFITLPLTVGTPISQMGDVARAILGHHPPIGTWGWTGTLLQFVHISGSIRTDPFALRVGSIGSIVTLVLVLAALWWWRRAHPVDMATAMTSVFLATTASYGDQYLAWPVPTTVAHPSRWALRLQPVVWIYIAVGALPSQLLSPHVWQIYHHVYIVASLVVIAAIIAMLPWERRVASATAGETAGRAPDRSRDDGLSGTLSGSVS